MLHDLFEGTELDLGTRGDGPFDLLFIKVGRCNFSKLARVPCNITLLEAQADGLLEGAKPIRGGLRRNRCSQALPYTFDDALAHTSEHHFFKAVTVDGELVEGLNVIDMVLLGAEAKLFVGVLCPLSAHGKKVFKALAHGVCRAWY